MVQLSLLSDFRSIQGFALNDLVLRTFAFAHLAHLDGIDDFAEEKPIGALIYSMQAVRDSIIFSSRLLMKIGWPCT